MEIMSWVRRVIFGVADDRGRRTFSSGPMPIDRMFADMRGRAGFVTREQALRVPGVLKGRNLLCSLSTLPLLERGPRNVVIRSPLLEQLDPNVPNVRVLADTFEDLLFDRISWWRVTARGSDNYPVSVRRCLPGSVSTTPPGGVAQRETDPARMVVWHDGREVPARDMIRFDSPNPGLLEYAGPTLALAVAYIDAARLYAKNPQMSEHFKPAANAPEHTDDEIVEAVSAWRAARRRGDTGYVPGWLEYVPSTSPSAADMKLPELKQQAALEVALCMGLDPEVLGVPITSRTYANRQDFARDRINDLLAPYMLAVTQRLSMMDVCRRGYVRVFDLDDYLRADPMTRVSYYQGLRELGAIDVEYIQQEEGLEVRGDLSPAAAPADPVAPADELSARRARVASFDGPAGRTFEFAAARFSVDAATRTITGLALPYNKVASKYGLKFKFAPGSLEWADDVSRVKMLKDHDYGQAHGVALNLVNGDDGLSGSFRIGAGADRDAVLADAKDGILDGLSVGVDFSEEDMIPDPQEKGVLLVQRATLREVSLTAMPAFDDARVTSVAARRDNGGAMNTCPRCGVRLELGVAHTCAAPANGPVTLTAEQFAALFPQATPPAPVEPGPVAVNPNGPAEPRPTAVTAVNEALPYRFVAAVPGRPARFLSSDHDFSTDLVTALKEGDKYGQFTDAGRRAMAFIAAKFDVDSADINEATPAIQRPDMYVDQRDYKYPLWNAVNKGAPPNGIQPFIFPKFNAASGLVAAHTEGTEPTGGTLTTTDQTVTPSAVSGKAYITREVWDMGGNPAVSGLIWNQMVRGYREALESATATFLNTLTAATDITLTAGAEDDVLADAWDAALTELQFVRGYDFETFAVEKVLYGRFAAARDGDKRPLFPILNPVNANGTASARFRTLNLSGVEGIPSWALASTAGSPNNSWLFDPTTVHGWATQPQRLEFEGASDDNTTVAPVAKIGLGIWGYKAFANSDIGGVRQVIYDSVA